MLIRNLYFLFCGSESQDGRSDCAPDVIEEKEHIVIIPEKFKDAVYTCFCPPAPNDGSRYVVQYKDGNPANLLYKNLELKQLQPVARHA